MFGAIHLDEISGGDFFEVLRNLILKCVPNGEAVVTTLTDYSVLFLILGIAAGISQCFFGYKLRKLWTAILMIVGCGFGSVALAEEFQVSVAGLIGLTAGMAIVGGFLGYFLWIAGCFLRPFVIVLAAVFAVFAIYGMQTLGLIVGLAAGLIVGIVAVAFYRVGLIVYSAVFGGLLAGECIWMLTGNKVWYPGLIIGGILALAGFGVQIFMNRKPREAAAVGTEPDVDSNAEQPGAEGVVGLFAAAQEGTGGAGVLLPPDGTAANGNEVILQLGNGEGIAPSGTLDGIFSQQDVTGGNQNGGFAADSAENGSSTVSAPGICPSCGTPYSARAKFCMQCGRKLQP